MENRPEYVCIWLGLGKIGVITSLINTNLRLDSLEHCITVCNSKGLIFSTEYSGKCKALNKEATEHLHYPNLNYPSPPPPVTHTHFQTSASPETRRYISGVDTCTLVCSMLIFTVFRFCVWTFLDVVADIQDKLPSSLQYFNLGGKISVLSTCLDDCLQDASPTPPTVDYKINFTGTYIVDCM